MSPQFFGKYRGKVESNEDPLKLGRLQVAVPAVYGKEVQNWAMPCVPYAGKGVGFFALPPKDANIWVEFEGGDLDYPIWSGCFWGDDEIPADPAQEKMKVFKTENITMTLNDDPDKGGFFLEVGKTPLKMTFDSNGIEIENQNSSIKLTDKEVTVKSNQVEISDGNKRSDIKLTDSKVIVKSDQVEIKNNVFSIKVTSSKVTINDGALEVT